MVSLLGKLDQAAIKAVRNGRRPAGVTMARVVSALAEPAFCGSVLAACVVGTAGRVGWRRACTPCVVVVSGAVARRALSKAIARPRPPADAWLAEPEGFSFPSKHTTLAALTAGACARSLGADGAARYAGPLLAAAGAGASRVYLGVHWPSDVLAAWLFAEGWLHLCESVLPASGSHALGQASGSGLTGSVGRDHGARLRRLAIHIVCPDIDQPATVCAVRLRTIRISGMAASSAATAKMATAVSET